MKSPTIRLPGEAFETIENSHDTSKQVLWKFVKRGTTFMKLLFYLMILLAATLN
jgi:hypothetical protein